MYISDHGMNPRGPGFAAHKNSVKSKRCCGDKVGRGVVKKDQLSGILFTR